MEEPSAPGLVIRMFGPFDAWVDGRPMPRLRSNTGQWLLALLALRHDREVQREWLAGTLWPDSDESNALYNLRRNLTDLRKALGAENTRLLCPTAHTLSLQLAGADVDLVAFEDALARGDTGSLEAAVRLYRASLLEGCLQDWVIQDREVCEQEYLGALETLADRALERRDPNRALGYLRLVAKNDPLRESAQRGLMRALADSGDYAAATAVYRELRVLLHREMSSDVAPETRALHESIRERAHARAAPRSDAEARPPRDAHAPPPMRRIPRPLTDLVGRDEEAREVARCLAKARLVTLTGAGGVGKTRLAIRVADELAEGYADGVCFVELGDVSEPARVSQVVASALELKEEPGVAAEAAVVGHLGKLEFLLVLDNCEHLLHACAGLCEKLLSVCPDLRILATTREALGITGETRCRVPSLASPDQALGAAPEEERAEIVMDHAATRLFVERARQVQPAFQLTPRNSNAVASICRRLDGIPLAIELAAARVRAMSVEQIGERLDNQFRLLTGGNRTAPKRQQTLEAAIAWSYDLLTEAERALLSCASVFAGGFTIEAAEDVCAGEGIEPGSILDLLTSLVDKSLVVYQEQDGRGRYRTLEMVRAFGRERLAEIGTEDALRSRHFDHFLRLAESAQDVGILREDLAQLDRLEVERGNLYAALEWAGHQDGGRELVLRLANALWRFWYVRGHANEGRAWLAVSPEDAAAVSAEVRARATNGAGKLALEQSDYAAARASLREALALWRELGRTVGIADASSDLGIVAFLQGDLAEARAALQTALDLLRGLGSPEALAKPLVWLGNIAQQEHDYDEARRLYEESLAIYRAQNASMRVAMVLNNLAVMAHEQEDTGGALSLYEQSLALYRQVGYRAGVATTLNNLGNIWRERGDAVEARRLLDESLEIRRELEDPVGTAVTLNTLGLAHCALREYAAARRCFTESAAIYQERHEPAGLAYSLTGMANVELTEGDPKEAARMLGAANNLRAHEAPLPPSDERDWLRIVASVNEELTEAELLTAWTEGAARPLSDLPGSRTVHLRPHTA